MRIKLLILSIIVAAGFTFAEDAVLFGNVLETDWILTPEGVTNAILATALTEESDPLAYPVATNALALAEGALQADATNGLLQAEADTFETVAARGATTTKAATFGSRGIGAVGASSFANGENVVASGDYSHAEGIGTTASGYFSHAEGLDTTASGDTSHAEGIGTTASGTASHAEGYYATASGDYSHAGGVNTTASGDASHASGFNSVASHITAFAWQGAASDQFAEPEYWSHGDGTYNLNPVGGLAGLWIGEENMATTLSGYATTGAVAAVQAAVAEMANIVTNLAPATAEFAIDVPLEKWRGGVGATPNQTVVTNSAGSFSGISVVKTTDLRAMVQTFDAGWQTWTGVRIETRWANPGIVTDTVKMRHRVDTLSTNCVGASGINTLYDVPIYAQKIWTNVQTVTNAVNSGACTIQLYRSDDVAATIYLLGARVIPFK